MPLYLYHCIQCDHEFEAFNRVEERNKQACLKCGDDVRILITTGSVITETNFPGRGFWKYEFSEPVFIKDQQHFEHLLKQDGACSGAYRSGDGGLRKVDGNWPKGKEERNVSA